MTESTRIRQVEKWTTFCSTAAKNVRAATKRLVLSKRFPLFHAPARMPLKQIWLSNCFSNCLWVVIVASCSKLLNTSEVADPSGGNDKKKSVLLLRAALP